MKNDSNFIFQLTKKEADNLVSQNVIPSKLINSPPEPPKEPIGFRDKSEDKKQT